MNFYILILASFLFAFENELIIVQRNQNEHPNRVCTNRGLKPVSASHELLPIMVDLLKKRNIFSSYVSGWYGTPQDMVVNIKGSVAPYDIQTNNTNYSFCMRLDFKDVGKSNKADKGSIRKILMDNLKTPIKVEKNQKNSKKICDLKVQEGKKNINRENLGKGPYVVFVPCHKVPVKKEKPDNVYSNEQHVDGLRESEIKGMVKIPLSKVKETSIDSAVRKLEKIL